MFGFIKKAVSDLFIARPPEATEAIVYRVPDQSVPNGAKLTVRADEMVLFFKEGVLAGQLGPGTYLLETSHLPFLGDLLVSPLTGDNHFITEIFFVRCTEYPYSLGPAALGSFQDIGSRLLVKLLYTTKFSVRVSDPVRFVTRLVGMRGDATQALAGFLDARVKSMLGQGVGRIMAGEPVLQVVSNQYGEQLGQAIIERARTEFANDGVEVTRFLSLDITLDASSEAELRALGGKLAELSVQREQADVGAQPGFAAYNLVKGQADLMRGVAAGAATHGLPAFSPALGGIGIGGAGLLGPAVGAVSQSYVAATPPAPRLAGGGGARYYFRGPGGVEGPYPPRQIALRALSLQLRADSVFVRQPGQSEWTPAVDVPDVATEIERRMAASGGAAESRRSVDVGPSASETFERALSVAAADKIITPDELSLLATLATAAGSAADASARDYVITRTRALGCTLVEATPAPPAPMPSQSSQQGGPPPLRIGPVYVYSNGMETVQGLSAEAVAARVRSAPDGVHMVWWNGASDWTSALQVDAVRALLVAR